MNKLKKNLLFLNRKLITSMNQIQRKMINRINFIHLNLHSKMINSINLIHLKQKDNNKMINNSFDLPLIKQKYQVFKKF